MYGFLVQQNVVRLETIIFKRTQENILKLKKYYADKFSKDKGIEIKSHHWVGNMQVSMEGITFLRQWPLRSVD